MTHDNEMFEFICLAHTPQTPTAAGSPNLLGFVDIKSVGVQSLRLTENLRRVIGDNFVPSQDKFRIEAVRGGFVNCLPRKISLQAIFIIVVRAGSIRLAIGCQHFLLIQHDELGTAPWLTRLADVSPEEIISTVKSSSNEIISGRFPRDRLIKK